jgi:hypothetical protein
MDKVAWISDDFGHLKDDKFKPHYLVIRHNIKSFEVCYRESNHGWQLLGANSSLKAAKKRVYRHMEGKTN